MTPLEPPWRVFVRCSSCDVGVKTWSKHWKVVDEGSSLRYMNREFVDLRYDRCYCNGRLYRGIPAIAHHLLVGLITGTHIVPMGIREWVFEYAAKCPEESKEGEECREEKLY